MSLEFIFSIISIAIDNNQYTRNMYLNNYECCKGNDLHKLICAYLLITLIYSKMVNIDLL